VIRLAISLPSFTKTIVLDLERQKVTRKIAQIKKQLASESSQGSDTSASRRKELENILEDLRVDLNYISVRRLCPLIFSGIDKIA
jgi:hypothetical protein